MATLQESRQRFLEPASSATAALSVEERQVLNSQLGEGTFDRQEANIDYQLNKFPGIIDRDTMANDYANFSRAMGGTGDSEKDYKERTAALKALDEFKFDRLVEDALEAEPLQDKIIKKLVTGVGGAARSAAQGAFAGSAFVKEALGQIGESLIEPKATIGFMSALQDPDSQVNQLGGFAQMEQDAKTISSITGKRFLPGDFISKTGIDFTKQATGAQRQQVIALHKQWTQAFDTTRQEAVKELAPRVRKNIAFQMSQVMGEDREEFLRRWRTDKEFSETLTAQVTEGAGQLGVQIPAAMVGAATPVIASQVFQGAVDDYFESIDVDPSEATDEQLVQGFEVGIMNSLAQTGIEKAGIDAVMGKLFKGGKITVGEALKRIGTGGLAEGTTEALQGAIQDAIANDVFDERDILTQQRLREFLVGAILGTGFSSVATGIEATRQFSENDLPLTQGEWQAAREALTDDQVRNSNLKPEVQSTFIDALNGDTQAQSDIIEAGKPKEGEVQEAEQAQLPTEPETVVQKHQELVQDADFFVKKKGDTGIFGKMLEPVSARVMRIAPEFLFDSNRGLRRFEHEIQENTREFNTIVQPFMKTINRLKKKKPETYNSLDIALKNSDNATVKELLSDKEFAQFEEVRQLLDDMFDKVKTNMDVELGFIENYFPRRVNDFEGLMEFLTGSKVKDEIQAEIAKQELERGAELTQQERDDIVNKFLQSVPRKSKTPSNFKQRKIESVDDAINEFYADPEDALGVYLERMAEFLAIGRMFNKFKSVEVDNDGRLDIQNSIGNLVSQLLQDGQVEFKDARELRDILQSRLNFQSSSKGISTFRAMGYIATMNSFNSAVTQLQDQAFSIYKNGFAKTAKNSTKALAGLSEIKRDEVVNERLGKEFRDFGKLAKWVDATFKWSGINYADKIGKESLMNSTIQKFRKKAKNDSFNTEEMAQLRLMFGGETQAAIEELKGDGRGFYTDFIAFNTLSDFQPISLSEMPEGYLNHPTGRIFYMLKTFTLRQWDVIRREAFDKMLNGSRLIGEGNKKLGQQQFVKGFTNLMRLTSLLVLGGWTADMIKDWMFGRDSEEPEDVLIDNIWKLAGLSRWHLFQFRNKQVSPGTAAALLVLPPMPWLEYPRRDALTAWEQIKKGEDFEFENMESWRILPIVGKGYYWRFGGGVEKIEKRKKQKAKEDSTFDFKQPDFEFKEREFEF